MVTLVEACWTVLDAVVAGAPAGLRKGPRGGGRDRDPMFDHVLAAEDAYARKLGVRLPTPDGRDPAAVAQFRSSITAALRQPLSPTTGTGKRWPPRYAGRRIAWHALDHAWEIEDRAQVG
jgi:hypothetical protein